MSLFQKIRKKVGIIVNHGEHPFPYKAKVKFHVADEHIATFEMELRAKDRDQAKQIVQQHLYDHLKHSITINRLKGKK